MSGFASKGLWPLVGLTFDSIKQGKLPPVVIIKALISKASIDELFNIRVVFCCRYNGA